VVRRIAIVKREIAAAGPLKILGRNFRGDVEFLGGVGAQDFSEDLLAVAFAVGPSGVEEIAAEIDGSLRASSDSESSEPVHPASPTCRNQFH